MIVCVCNNKSESEVRKIIKEKPDITLEEFQAFNVCDQCCKCAIAISEILDESDIS